MTAAIARSLELLYIDGHPDGMLTAELSNWSGHVLMAPRTQIADVLRRPEASCAGIYLLIGENEVGTLAYLGEGEDIGDRIRAHDSHKDWWTSVVLVTAGTKLNKAHVRYLEARLIAEARRIGRVPLENSTNPPRPPLSEADVAKMEAFLENLRILLPAVRVDMFIQRVRSDRPAERHTEDDQGTPSRAERGTTSNAPLVRFRFELPRHGLQATARMVDGDFIVEAGSQARSRWEGVAGQSASYAPLHEELVRSGVLVLDSENRVFTRDYAFRSPSAAAAVVAGRSCSGPTAWRLQGENIFYKEWEARQIAATNTASE